MTTDTRLHRPHKKQKDLPEDQRIPEPGTFDRPKRPRPREQKLLQVLASGTARSLSDAMMQSGINPSATSIRRRLGDGGDLRHELDKALKKAGLTLPVILTKIVTKLDARKPLTIAGEAIETDDNDAQLRAVDMGIKLLDRTGKLPANQKDTGNGGSTITVNIIRYSSAPEPAQHQDSDNLKSIDISKIEEQKE